MITQERLKELFSYDSMTGIFIRKVNMANKHAGDIVGSKDCAGYLKISINGKFYYLHRLAWLYQTGNMPNAQIDHKNGIRTDNRFENLRDVPLKINLQNIKSANKGNKSTSLLGAYKLPNSGKCTAKIKLNGKSIHLGTFDNAELAHQAYIDAKRKYHEGNML